MKNLGLFVFLIFAITGLMIPSIISDSSASTDNNGRDQGTKTANGCNNGTAKNNPNCTSDVGPFTLCDGYDSDSGHAFDGSIDKDEITDWINDHGIPVDDGIVSKNILAFEENAKPSNPNEVIDTENELVLLNGWLDSLGIPMCI